MQKVLHSLDEVKAMIGSGKALFLAGDEEILEQLPSGNWIAGTIPYFVGEMGGETTRDKVYVTELPDYVKSFKIKVYDEKEITKIFKDIPDNGFGFIIIPATSALHASFALKAPTFPDFATKPLIGWISGVHLNDLGKIAPKVMDGKNLQLMTDKAVVALVDIKEGLMADMGIVNIFEQGDGDTISFPNDGFTVTEALINNKKYNLADYMLENKFSTQLPLVADYYGVPVNISFQSVDADKHEVTFYAPVFGGVQYKLAAPIKDYVAEFMTQIPSDGSDIMFSCNCILNYLYSGLEGKRTGDITGPITFGEIAYQLLNQTMVYLTVSADE